MARCVAALLDRGADVLVRRGRLMLRVLVPVPSMLKRLRLHPDDPDDPTDFRVDLGHIGFGTIGVLFGRTSTGRTALHLDAIPLTLEKRPGAWTGGRRAAVALAGGVAVPALLRRRAGR